MTTSIKEIEPSLAFRVALLQSEKKRIIAVIVFVLLFALLIVGRIFLLGSAMSRYGLLAAAILISFELWLLRVVNRALHSGQIVPRFLWYCSLTLESLFPALGIAFFASNQLHIDYRPLATPWAVAYFPLILLTVLRLNPKPKLTLNQIGEVLCLYLARRFATAYRLETENLLRIFDPSII